MSNKDIASNIIDNSEGRELVKVIKDRLREAKEAKFAIGYFFLSGFNLVKGDFPQHPARKPFLKLVMGDETTLPTREELVAGYNLRERLRQRMIEELQGVGLTEEAKHRIKELRGLIEQGFIEVRLYSKSRLHAKLYLFLTRPDEPYESRGLAVVGSSNFTAMGLAQNKELNVLLTSRQEVDYLDQWFDRLWDESIEFNEDALKVIDVSGILPGSQYPKIGKNIDPKTLFKYLVYNWFEGRVLNLLKKDILMEFQLVGVVNATNILSFYNGVILADSVGLGKSFMAGAIVEEFLNRKHPAWLKEGKDPAVLLILPPSLIAQWEELLINIGYFFKGYEKELIKKADNHRIYRIYNGQKEIGKIGFLSLGIFQNLNENELKAVAEEFDLYVIDEAHKYRNKNTNRWKNVRKMQKKKGGFSNRFVLLTATPLNNSIEDIFNLIRLFSDDTFAPFRVKGIQITQLIKEYRELKNKLRKTDNDRDIKRDLKRIAAQIKQQVLDEIMVLRTRKYIMEQFKDLKINGRELVFKDPKPYILDYSPFTTGSYRKLMEVIKKRLESIAFEYTKVYGTRYVIFEEDTVGDEEENKMHYVEVADLFKLLLGKRLESGIFAFETTLRRIYEKERVFYNIFKEQVNSIVSKEQLIELVKEAMKQANIDKELEEIKEEYDVEEQPQTWFDRLGRILHEYAQEMNKEDEKLEEQEVISMGLKRLLENLENDMEAIEGILVELDKMKKKENGRYKISGKIPKQHDDLMDMPIYAYSSDPKLEALKQIIGHPAFKSEKLRDVPSLNGKKIVIFTQYRDTAYYLYHNLLDWIKGETDLYVWLKSANRDTFKIGLVTGDTDTPTKLNYIKRFSPYANGGSEEAEKWGDIEILISTDSLSEGVNLQDADAVINYDLPWNPMVIVQRVGRVNRIGNDRDVYVINYLPSEEVEVIVGVLKKLKEKIKDITLIVGKDVRILSQDEEVSIETFGEKIKDISKLSVTDLEQYGLSEDFRQLIPEGIPQEQMDEYRLLNFIQYDLGYTAEDFEEIRDMGDGPYYTFIKGDDRVIGVYEFYRGKYRIMKRIMSVSGDGEVEFASPMVFFDLIKGRVSNGRDIIKTIERLKKMKDRAGQMVQEMKENYQQEQKGFLYQLYNALFVERARAGDFKEELRGVLRILQVLPYHLYSREIKELLVEKEGVVEMDGNTIRVKDLGGTVRALNEYFEGRGLTDIESLKPREKFVGWYHEV